MNCIFCKIVSGEAFGYIVHRDDLCTAFLDHKPVRPGALMVVPNEHIDEFCDLDENLSAHILLVAQRLSRKMRQTLKPLRVGLAVSGFGVPHAHLHVVPMHHPHDVTSGVYAFCNGVPATFTDAHIAPASEAAQITALDALREIDEVVHG